ncbi:Eyes absent-like protein [Bienertia sinuspersici]
MTDCRENKFAPENEKCVNKDSSGKKKIVYIWDMDETLILLKSLLDGTYAVGFSGVKDVQRGIDIGKMWEKLILDVCDDYFFYKQIESYNEPSINALSPFDDGADLSCYDFSQDSMGTPKDDLNKRKLAYRHRIISQKYKQGLHSILDRKKIEFWNDLYKMTDSYTDKWLSSARTLLQHCSGVKELTTNGSDFQCINVLVTAGSLIPSLVKCLLFRLDNLITCENVPPIVLHIIVDK